MGLLRAIPIALAACAGCYSAPTTPCTLTCSDTCPGDLRCVDGFCVAEGATCTPSFRRVSAGNGFACGLDDAGALWCWGTNAHHAIDGTATEQYEVVTRVGTRTWESVSVGGHACGISDGELYCWGRNERGQIAGTIAGDVDEPLAIQVPVDGPARWTAVTAGYNSTCAIGEGKLYCWGAGDTGQLGTGATVDVTTPTRVSTLADFTAVANGWGAEARVAHGHTCAVSASTGLWCWGWNANGQLGNATAVESDVPVQVTLPSPPVTVAAGLLSTCVTTADQHLYCWGYAGNHALGDPNAVAPVDLNNAARTELLPVLASGLDGWTKVVSAEHAACALRGDEVWCWGQTQSGGLGHGVWGPATNWGRIAIGATDVSLANNANLDDTGADAVDLDLGCYVADGRVACWGDNRVGQLAQGGATQSLRPREVAGHRTWSTIAAGTTHTCGIAGSDVYCWGSTQGGQATGRVSGTIDAPCGVAPDLACDAGLPTKIADVSGAAALSVGTNHTCALGGNGLTCWGDDAHWQLGNGYLPPAPTSVPGTWTTLFDTRGDAQCAASTAGDTSCWGDVIAGEQMPSVFPDLAGMISVGFSGYLGAGYSGFGCYLDQSRALACFGGNDQGQFGNGGLAPATCGNAACDNNETCETCPGDCGCAALPAASCGDGTCNAGETSATCPSDCGMPPMTRLVRRYKALAFGWAASNTSLSATCGIRSDGALECWGRNRSSIISNVAVPATGAPPRNVYSPATIAGLANCTAVTVGQSFICAACNGALSCWGDNRRGQLGSGPISSTAVTQPRAVELVLDPGDSWVQLTAGNAHACGRTSNGRVYCWGGNLHGALGFGASANAPVAVRFTAP